MVAAGFIRGTVFGRIQSLDILLGSRYGVVWLIALAVGLFVACGRTSCWPAPPSC